MDAPLRIGDRVLYKNNQLIAFDKPPGIPVQDDKTGDSSLLQLGSIYCQSQLYLIHRIDRPASGVVLFAKNTRALTQITEQFQQRTAEKIYLAVVANLPGVDEGTLIHFITKNGQTNRAVAHAEEKPGAQRAELHFRHLGSIDHYHLLEIKLITGRHHQIRAQLAAIGCPIKGDVKYGARRKNEDRSIHLHAWRLSFTHPVSGERETIEAPIPNDPVWNAFREE